MSKLDEHNEIHEYGKRLRLLEEGNYQLKQQIEHRLYASRRKAGKPLGSLATKFATCLQCAGRGKYCFERIDHDRVPEASLETCPKCAGHGFVSRESLD